MKKTRLFSLLLAGLLLTSALTSCKTPKNDEPADTNAPTATETTQNTTETDKETETEEETMVQLEGDHALLISNAAKLANGVQAYYTDADRKGYRVENLGMTLDYSLAPHKQQDVSTLQNKNGGLYLQNTMRVFIKTESGKTYYATTTGQDARVNIYRLGYYYYDVHFLESDFVNPDKSSDKLSLTLDRTMHTFPDKLHQELHIVAYEDTDKLSEIGMITEIAADTVQKLIVKDKNGTHVSLDGIDWTSAEYVGFDIKNAGIFGYILPYDGQSGSITVELKGSFYIITQTATPEGGRINAPTGDTANDFRMGQRLYTDESHDFDAFLEEAYCERNPLGEENILIDEGKMARGALFKGYDALRGVYRITMKGPGSFNEPYYNTANLHYNASFALKGDDRNRSLYIMTYTPSGFLECAALLDANNTMLPVKLEVSKNFSENEEPIYNCGDQSYGEVFFPVKLEAGAEDYLTVLNLYQNWGQYPLKQLSSIGFYQPYYHLSTGVTETNCISPWHKIGQDYSTLPDHRPMSMPASCDLVNKYPQYGNQPQRPNTGVHDFLQYTDSQGNYVTTEIIENRIDSAGPTYADLTRTYITGDGKIKVTYRHLEMPQTDENRTYYEIQYEVLEDISFNNFGTDFTFYSVRSFYNHEKVGYLDHQNKSRIANVNSNPNRARTYTLGDECPYFSYFYSQASVYSNTAFLILDSEFIIGGELNDAKFLLRDQNRQLSLSLDLEQVTLKKGDSFKINAILLPWGGGWVTDDGKQYHATDDTNVRLVRENSLLNRFTVTADGSCEALDSVFLPHVKSADGFSASFTLSGGCDSDKSKAEPINMAVRVDGFKQLGIPVVEELVNGKWVRVALSSESSPDKAGNKATYDGCSVHYEGDGSYGYSFVTTVTDGQPRSFRVSVEEPEKLPQKPIQSNKAEDVGPSNAEDPRLEAAYAPSVYFDADDLYELVIGGVYGEYPSRFSGYDQVSRKEEDGVRYISLLSYNDAENLQEAYISPINGRTEVPGIMAIKYRTNVNGSVAEIFTGSEGFSANGNSRANFGLQADGEWQLLIIELDKKFTQFDGKALNYMRFDYLNKNPLPQNASMDIAYIAFFESEKDAKDFEYGEGNTGDKVYIDPSSGYKETSLAHATFLDMINGMGGDANSFSYRGGNSADGIDTFIHNATTLSGGMLVFSGWTVIEGGVKGFVWSVDGGKTWHNAVFHKKNGFAAGSDAHLEATSKLLGGYTFKDPAASKAGAALYQCSAGAGVNAQGIAADLSAYIGQTVNVTLAAIPKNDEKSLALVAYVTGIKVVE